MRRAWRRCPRPKQAKRGVAEGPAIAEPLRGPRLLHAIPETDGTYATMENERTRAARRRIYVEPTSATAVAVLHTVLPAVRPGETVVIPLTGE